MSDNHLHLQAHSEVSYTPEHAHGTKQIWKVFWILLGITIVEVCIGLSMYVADMSPGLHIFLKGIIVILGLSKAFYIIAYFMHMADEIKNFIMVFIMPILFILWGIVALVIDGKTVLDHKKKFDSYYHEKTKEIERQPDVKNIRPTHHEGHHATPH